MRKEVALRISTLAVISVFILGLLSVSSVDVLGISQKGACRLLSSPDRVDLSGGAESALLRACATLAGADVRVNNPTGDPGNNTTQSETTIAISGSLIVTGWNDSSQFNTNNSFTGYGCSEDGGVTFVDKGSLLPGAGDENDGDPDIAVDRNGNLYFSHLVGRTIGGVFHLRLGVAKAAAPANCAGLSFGTPVVFAGIDPNGDEDKEFIAVGFDPTLPSRDNIYVTWSEFPSTGGSRILFSRSLDGGITFSTPIVLNTSGTSNSGSMPVVDTSNGHLYVVWEDRSSSLTGVIRVRKSTDGGQNFSAQQTVASFTRVRDNQASGQCGRPALKGNVRVNDFPIAAVDPNTHNVYVVFNADPNNNQNNGDDSDVFFTGALNGNTGSWSTKVAVHKSGACTSNCESTSRDQWMPFITVAPNGNLEVLWYDRRNDSNNTNIEAFKALSTNQGTSFTNIKVSNVAFGVPTLNPNFDPLVANCYMGDYNHMAADASNFYSVWGDNRDLCQSGAGCSPVGRPDPNIYSEKETLAGVAVTSLSTISRVNATHEENATLTTQPSVMPLKFTALKVSMATAQGVHFAVEGSDIQDLAVEIFDMAGRRVFSSGFFPGRALSWNLLNNKGDRVARGVYLYVVTVRGFDSKVIRSEVKKLVLVLLI